MLHRLFVLTVAALLMCSGCTGRSNVAAVTTKAEKTAVPAEETLLPKATVNPPKTSEPPATPDAPKGELMAFVTTMEEAQRIAELYGIELISYANKIALYHTEESPKSVISQGKANGWPELSVNGRVEAY